MLKQALIAAALLVSTTANAGFLSAVANAGLETKQPTANYKLDTYGFAVRVYEWTPKGNPKITCVFVAGNENSTGVACYPKKK